MVKAEYREETLEQLEDFFEFAPVGMQVVDGEGIIQRANIAELELLGYFGHADDIVGKSVASLFVDAGVVADLMKRAQQGETVNNVVTGLKARDGAVVQAIVDVNAQRSETGAVLTTRWFVRPEKPMELPTPRAVQLSEDVVDKIARMSAEQKTYWFDVLNDFFDNAPVGVHFVGLNGVMMRANKAEVDLLGYSDDPGGYIGRHVRHIHHETAVVESLLQRLVEGIPVISKEAYLKRKNGDLEAVLIYSGLRLKDGKFQNTRCFLFSNPSPSLPPTVTHVVGYSWPRNEEGVAA